MGLSPQQPSQLVAGVPPGHSLLEPDLALVQRSQHGQQAWNLVPVSRNSSLSVPLVHFHCERFLALSSKYIWSLTGPPLARRCAGPSP